MSWRLPERGVKHGYVCGLGTNTEMKTLYDEHIAMKNMCLNAKVANKQAASQKANTMIATFDLESALQIPCSQVSTLYYSRKLNMYNLMSTVWSHLRTLFATAGLKLTAREAAAKLEHVFISGWQVSQIQWMKLSCTVTLVVGKIATRIWLMFCELKNQGVTDALIISVKDGNERRITNTVILSFNM